jgi:hypothetical protein
VSERLVMGVSASERVRESWSHIMSRMSSQRLYSGIVGCDSMLSSCRWWTGLNSSEGMLLSAITSMTSSG